MQVRTCIACRIHIYYRSDKMHTNCQVKKSMLEYALAEINHICQVREDDLECPLYSSCTHYGGGGEEVI